MLILKLNSKHCCQGKPRPVHPTGVTHGICPSQSPSAVTLQDREALWRQRQPMLVCNPSVQSQGNLIPVLTPPLNIKDQEQRRRYISDTPLWDLGTTIIGNKLQQMASINLLTMNKKDQR